MSDDRFLRTSKLLDYIDVGRSCFYRHLQPRLVASGSVRVLGAGSSGRGRRWHVGDVVGFMLAHPYREPEAPETPEQRTPYEAPVGSAVW